MRTKNFDNYLSEDKNHDFNLDTLSQRWMELSGLFTDSPPIFLITFLKGVAETIRHIKDKSDQSITIHNKSHKNGYYALNYLFYTGIYKNMDFDYSERYFSLDDLRNLLQENNPSEMRRFHQEIVKPSLLLIGQTEYALDNLHFDLLLKFSQAEPEVKREKNLKFINDYLLNVESDPPILYFEANENGAILIISEMNSYLKSILNEFPKLMSDWENLEARKNSTKLLIILSKLNLPPPLLPMILDYLSSGHPISHNEIRNLLRTDRQFRALKIPQFDSTSFLPDVLKIYGDLITSLANNLPARVSYVKYFIYKKYQNYTFYADPTRGLAKLINGIEVDYDISGDPIEVLTKYPSAKISLLNFLKNFRNDSQVSKEGRFLAGEVLSGILNLAQVHSIFKLNCFKKSQLLKNIAEIKQIPVFNNFEAIQKFEDVLNDYLFQSGCEKQAIDFIHVDQNNSIILYLKKNALKSVKKFLGLTQNLPPKCIHSHLNG